LAEFAREHADALRRVRATSTARAPPRSSRWASTVGDAELDDLRGNVSARLRDRLSTASMDAGRHRPVAGARRRPARRRPGSTPPAIPNINLPWTTVGFPALTVPAGKVDGLPVGLQLVARYSDDELLLAWAEEIASIVGGE
jgi:Asp-tRNA(Asn)/Glu-tRNA(Gln) amidotransferase A subunit family amidase